MKDKGTIRNWFFNNSWSIIVAIVGFITGLAILKYQVNINTRMIYALQDKVDTYPSEQYFDLRFSNIEKSLDEVKSDLKMHVEDTK